MSTEATAEAAALPFAQVAGGVRVRVRLTPRARDSRVLGLARDADGRPELRVHVTEAPEDGRANRALVRLLATTWRLPKSAIRIVGGTTDRRKTVVVDGDGADLLTRLSQWATPLVPADGA
jgi:hypothetical protein